MRTAAIYARISEDTEGRELGVARQEDDCRALASRHDYDVVDIYIDNDVGASTRSRAKRRPQYERMLTDARNGKFAVILAYSNSRLTRRPMETEGLIQLHEKHGTRIVTVVSGEDNLSTADGRQMARIKANIDTGEAERTAERVARKHLELAQAGKPVGGTRPFGWQKDHATIEAGEAALIRKAADAVIAGVPMRRIAAEWAAQGVLSPRGRPWQAQTAREMLRSPRLAGWRIHRGKVAIDRAGQPVRGQWEPILDDATHKAVVAALTSPERRSRIPRKGARRYLMSGLLRCGVCNSVMWGNKVGDAHYYACKDHGHGNSVSGRGVDALVAELVLGRLAAVDLDRPVPMFDGQARLDAIGGKIAELMAAFNAGTLSGAVVFPAVTALETERDTLTAQRDRVETAALGPDVTHVDREVWVGLDVDRRRAVAESVLDAVLIKPTVRRTGNRFDHERVVPVWR